MCFVSVQGSPQIWAGCCEGRLAVYNGGSSYEVIQKMQMDDDRDDFTALCSVFDLTTPSLGSGTASVRMWCGSRNGSIVVFDCATFRKEMEIKSHADSINQIKQVGKDHVWTVSSDGSIRIWDLNLLQPIRKLEDHGSGVKAIALVECNQHVWTSGFNGVILVRGIKGDILQRIEVGLEVTTLLYTCEHVWVTTADGNVSVYHPGTLECLKTISAHQNPIDSSIATTKQVWTCSQDKIQIFDAKACAVPRP